jgi:hypothetical protein
LLVLLLVAWSRTGLARVAAVEIEPRVEAALDARAVRRLIQLELSEVVVPPRPGELETELFVRVLSGAEGQFRVELWERGEQHGARLVSGAESTPSVAARRVALAAAELARGLRHKRRLLSLATERARRRAEREERLRLSRTLDGPVAFRAGGEWVWGRNVWLLGPTLDGELSVLGRLRMDVGAAWTFGLLTPGSTGVESLTLRMGPARRFVLGTHTDLDLGLRAEAALLTFQGVRGVDQMHGERQSWSVRVLGVARFERRLSRGLRLELGVLGGAALRRVPVTLADGRGLRLGGGLVGAELGLVLTPETRAAVAR